MGRKSRFPDRRNGSDIPENREDLIFLIVIAHRILIDLNFTPCSGTVCILFGKVGLVDYMNGGVC